MNKINYTSFVILLILIPIINFSQTFEWLKTKNINYEINPGMLLSSTIVDNNGNVYFFGLDSLSQAISIYAYGPLFLQKYDPSGNLLDSHLIEGEASVTGMICDQNGNVYLFGKYISEISFWGQLTLQAEGLSANHFYVKIDESGDVQWGKNMNELSENFSGLFDATVDELGNTYVAYDTWSDSYISKFNPDGEIENVIFQENIRSISGVSIDNDGNLIVAGSCAGSQNSFNGVFFENSFAYNYYIVKYSADWSPVWVKFVEDVTCTFTKVAVDDENNIYWSGPLMVETEFDDITADGPAWVFDFFLVKLNPAGEYQWLKEVPETLTGDASTGNLQFLDTQANGNIVMVGSTRGFIEWENGIVSNGEGMDYAIIIWEFDSDGNLVWVKTAGGTSYDYTHSVSCDSSGNIYMAGTVGKTVVFDTITHQSDNFAYPFLSKLNTEIITDANTINEVFEFLVYPNPVHDHIKLSLSEITAITIINSTGQNVYRSKQVNQESIQVSNLPKGLYNIRAKTIRGKIYTSKFIKQ